MLLLLSAFCGCSVASWIWLFPDGSILWMLFFSGFGIICYIFLFAWNENNHKWVLRISQIHFSLFTASVCFHGSWTLASGLELDFLKLWGRSKLLPRRPSLVQKLDASRFNTTEEEYRLCFSHCRSYAGDPCWQKGLTSFNSNNILPHLWNSPLSWLNTGAFRRLPKFLISWHLGSKRGYLLQQMSPAGRGGGSSQKNTVRAGLATEVRPGTQFSMKTKSKQLKRS